MAKRKVAQTEEYANVQQAPVTEERSFLEKNQNMILYVLVGAIVLFLAWWGYKKLIVEPKQKEAVVAMWQAQAQFERDSFEQALNNPGPDASGLLAIIDQYGNTDAGNLARYMAGVSYLQLGDFDNAISQLEAVSASGDYMPILKNGVLGDAYSEKKDFAKALELYEKASNSGKNDILASYYLKKFGMLNEVQGNKEASLKAFQRLRTEFPNQNSADWRDAEKYIYKNGGM